MTLNLSDKELLILAAKAAKYPVGKHTQKYLALTLGGVEWNPLTDDGDALRLAVKLNIYIDPGTEAVKGRNAEVDVMILGKYVDTIYCNERLGTDPYAATRRAIVRAAAELGARDE